MFAFFGSFNLEMCVSDDILIHVLRQSRKRSILFKSCLFHQDCRVGRFYKFWYPSHGIGRLES